MATIPTQQSTSFVVQNIDRLSRDFLDCLAALLDEPDNFEKLCAMIKRAGITLERGDEQITFSSEADLVALKQLLGSGSLPS
jgi:hypothetical protein